MKKWILIACALAAVVPGPSRSSDQSDAAAWVPRAEGYLREFGSLCRKDGGKLWGVSFCGPMLLVDPGSRLAVGNEKDVPGLLKPQGSVFAGKLSEDVALANTATEWGGKRWTMIMAWSLGGSDKDRLSLMAHEAFHRVQPELHLDPAGEINDHLDSLEGRFWLQMEWNALQKALQSKGEERRGAVRDALAFRTARRDRFPRAAGREIPLEIFEGLAEYSGMRLAGFSGEEVVEAVGGKRKAESGFVRSFAYVSGPLYGFLLDATGPGWRSRVKSDTDLGSLLGDSLGLKPGPPESAETRADAYGGAALRASEEERDREHQARRAAWREALIDGPVLMLELKSVTSGSFDPGKVFPFGEKQTVYGTRELIGAWGKLTVEEGAILEDRNTGEAHVSLRGAAPDHLAGEGWTLHLETGWEVAPGGRDGDFVVRKR